jgi:dipeptidase D
MSNPIEGLRPEAVWKYFAEISGIPRCSKHEEKISRYVFDTAKRMGLQAWMDNFGNVVVRKPASAGKEHVTPIVLQGHLDMVCEKNKGTVHDFAKDPLRLVRHGNAMMADGTTLGADNGIAVATNLAIMEDSSLQHGPLEFLFTVDEETGLTGANNLGPDFLKGRTLINLDSEEEGALYVGCSGGRNTTATWKLARQTAPPKSAAGIVRVKGLKGGHSGLEIDKNRGNAIKILGRVLLALQPAGARLVSLDGGNKTNAIPREAEATITLPKNRWDAAAAIVKECNDIVRAECATVEPDLSIGLEEAKGLKRVKVMSRGLQRKVLAAISAFPHGVTKMSADIPGLVETSTNVAVVRMMPKAVEIITSQRSSVASELDEICHTVRSVSELAGAKASTTDGYPGWKPNLDSPILKAAVQTYTQLHGKEPAVKAIHAGLECGIIGEKYPGMDMVSMGPTLEGVHSPDEKIHIDTVEKYWDFLLAILRNVS